MEDIAFEAAELIDLEAENPFAAASLSIASQDLSQLKDDYKIQMGYTSSESPSPDWGKLIFADISENGTILEDFEVGVTGVKQIGEQTWGYISFLANRPEEVTKLTPKKVLE